jgi:exopolysaccharide biosynthesis polyprenyl glycosylphosphotransferase
MILQRKRGLQTVLLWLQCLLVAISFTLCLWGTSFFIPLTKQQVQHEPIYTIVMIVGLLVEANRRNHQGKHLNSLGHSFILQHQVSLHQTLYAMGALFVYLVVVRENPSRISLGICAAVLYATLLWSNRYLWWILANSLFSGLRKGRILLVGAPPKAMQLRRWLNNKEIFGMETLGILSDEPIDPEIARELLPLGRLAEVEKVIRQYGITQIILLQLPDSPEVHKKMMAAMERHGVRLLIFNNLEEKLNHPVIYIEDEGHHFISLREEPLENPLNRIAKRTLDIAVALPVVLTVLPVAAIFVRTIQLCRSPGPLFFKQVRAGMQNQQFMIWKFRTMHVNNPDAARQATWDDDRIYPGGRFLRRFSIDELPQFWNVLKGDMSVSGPRPHLIEHNEQFAKQIASYPIRTVVKPGITGLAQVRGFRGEARTPNDIALRLESDIVYLENWRLSLDLVIILRTVWQMIVPPKTAY